MSQPEEGEDGQQRPEVSEEDLVKAKDNLGVQAEVKGKTFEVMQECERAGKTAPSVFSGLRSGAETAFSKPPTRPIRKKQ